MNWLETIIAQAEAEAAKLASVAPEVLAGIAKAKALVTSPAAQELIAVFKTFTTHTATPGSAVITEPNVTTTIS